MNIDNIGDFTDQAGDVNKGAPIMVNGYLQNNNKSTLRHEEGILFDEAIIKTTTETFAAVNDLRSRGLVKDLGGLGTIISKWQRQGYMTGAEVDMEGIAKTQNDHIKYDTKGVPVPIIHKNFSLNMRFLEESRRNGTGVDTEQAEICGRIVADKLETILFDGIPNFKVGGFEAFGYTNFPDRNTGALTYEWAAAATTGKQIDEDLRKIFQAAADVYRYTDFILYVAKDVYTKLESDYSDQYPNLTIRQRLEQTVGLDRISIAPQLATGEVVMVQMRRDVVDLGVGQDITNLQWSVDPMSTNYKVMMAAVPRLKSEQDGNCGIFHYTYIS